LGENISVSDLNNQALSGGCLKSPLFLAYTFPNLLIYFDELMHFAGFQGRNRTLTYRTSYILFCVRPTHDTSNI